MTFNAPSFFVGVGTVVILLAFGFGGGVLVSGIVSDTAPREPSRVERRAAAPEPAPPTVATKPVAVAPAPTGLQAPTPSDPSPKPGESANALVAPPQNPTPAQQPAQPVTPAQSVTPAADTAPPPLGPQQPVALVNPTPDQVQDRGTAITQQAKRLAEERKNAERRKKAERARQRETRQARQQRAPAGSSSEDDADNDVRGERPSFMLRERREFGGPPLFRFFSNED